MKKIRFSISLVVATVFLLLTALPLAAIPGVDDILPTESGQYVYYRDNTFRTETYIGFLQYDEGTYAIRYYAPNPEIGSNEIELLLTVDPNQDYILMTGERIIGDVTSDDTDTLNYMHDLVYELSSRRKKVIGRDFMGTNPLAQGLETSIFQSFSGTVRNTEDYSQYGGNVTLTYDLAIPIFNLRSITLSATNENFSAETQNPHEEGTVLLMAVTMGQLADSDDQSFSNFTGIPPIPSIVIEGEKLSDAQLEESWVQVQDNYWFINSDALMYIYDLEIDQAFFQNQEYTDIQHLSRQLSFGTAPNRVYLPAQSLYMQNGSLVLSNFVYMSDSQLFSRDTKIITPAASEVGNVKLYTVTVITAFYNYYYNNQMYFQNKINSITE